MGGVTPHGIRYPDGASKAKNLGPELKIMAEDIDFYIGSYLSPTGPIRSIIIGVAQEIVPPMVEQEIESAGLVIAIPKTEHAQTSRASLPISWKARRKSVYYPSVYPSVYPPGVWTDQGHYGGEVPILTPSGRIPTELLPSYNQDVITVEEVHIGDSVRLREVQGARGHRLQYTSRQPGNENARPYMEVNASALDANGDVIAGYQSHVTGDGTTPNSGERVYWFLEAHGLTHTVNANPDLEGWYSMGVANRAELTPRGRGRAFVLDAGNRPGMAMHFYKPYVELQKNTAFTLDDRARPAFGDGVGQNHVAQTPGTLQGGDYINFRREGALGIRLTGLSDAAETAPQVFMGRSRGTVLDPSNVRAGDRLGAIQAGTQTDITPDHVHIPSAGASPLNRKHVTAELVARATENYTPGTAQGSRLDLDITRPGTATKVTGLTVEEPGTDETSILVRVNRDGTTTKTRVQIGAPDSGGPGLRALVIPN